MKAKLLRIMYRWYPAIFSNFWALLVFFSTFTFSRRCCALVWLARGEPKTLLISVLGNFNHEKQILRAILRVLRCFQICYTCIFQRKTEKTWFFEFYTWSVKSSKLIKNTSFHLRICFLMNQKQEKRIPRAISRISMCFQILHT